MESGGMIRRALGWVHGAWALLYVAAQEFRADKCVRHAAATSYFAILSFLPFLILVLSCLGFVLAALGSSPEAERELLEGILQNARQVLPFLDEGLKDRLREIIGAREAFGIVGAVVLLFTSSLVFGAIEDALAAVFNGTRTRHVVVSKLVFLVFLGALGLFAVIGHYVLVLVDTVIAAGGGNPIVDRLYSSPAVGLLLTYAGAGIGFGVLVRYFSTTRLSLPHVAAGATLFFLLWELALQAFTLYVEHIARFNLLYGSVSTAMVLIVWVFYTACIFLYCAEVVKLLSAET